MGLIEFVILLGVLCIVWILLAKFWGPPEPIRSILGIVFSLIIIIALLQLFGLTNFHFRH